MSNLSFAAVCWIVVIAEIAEILLMWLVDSLVSNSSDSGEAQMSNAMGVFCMAVGFGIVDVVALVIYAAHAFYRAHVIH